MTKNFVKMLTIMMVAMFSFSFAACGSDDDNSTTGGGGGGGSINAQLLIGLWEGYSVKMMYEGQLYEEKIDPKHSSRLEVIDSKNYKTYEWSKDKEEWVSEEYGTYVLNGNKLTTADNFGKSHTLTIISVTSDFFVYEAPVEGEDDMDTGAIATITYKRVK